MTSPGSHAAGGIVAHIRSLVPSLLPAEQSVAEVILATPESVIEMSSQQVATAAGASRATVVRMCQRLGFTGYQQLRVMLARDLGPGGGAASAVDGGGDATPAGDVRACFAEVGDSLPAMTALLETDTLTRAVDALAGAGRLVISGNGLSAPLAQLASQRLIALGLLTQAPTDAIAQQVAARHLGAGDVLLAISGSGANETTIRCAHDAHDAGGTVVLVTAFGRSPLSEVADIVLVVGMRDPTFRDELTVTTRIPQFILLEGLVAGISRRLGQAGGRAHAATMDVIARNLAE